MSPEAEALMVLVQQFRAAVGDLPLVENEDTSVLANTKLGKVLREYGFDVEPDDYDRQWVLFCDVEAGAADLKRIP